MSAASFRPLTGAPARYTVTAALIYANGPIHIGHLAGCYLPADIYVRYLRATGADVAFISGTDEHGVPITIKAKKEGTTPQAVVDKYYTQISQAFADFGVSFDIYSRTSSPHHHAVSQAFFRKLYDTHQFIEETSEQYFDKVANQFLADRYIVGTCPVCANENAYGDQCERCGSALSPTELKNPRSTLSGAAPVLRPTTNWYLPLDQLQPQLEAFIGAHPEWKTNVAGQCRSWLNEGLRPRAMTRDLDWGVRVPIEGTEGKVLYVWFDAPIGYITFTQEWAAREGKDWEPYWKSADTKLVHFIGKDNIVFHCLIFPGMLLAEGSYILPDNVPANEFLNLEGDKISTSRNWAVWLHEYLHDFPGKADVLRYALCANAPETKDNDFTWKDFQARNNSELADNLGNFINRALVLTQKYFASQVPATGELLPIDHALLVEIGAAPTRIAERLQQFRFRDALTEVMSLSRAGNKYLAETEPWKLIKTIPERVPTILNLSLQLAATLAIVLEPFMPQTSTRLNAMLGLPTDVANDWQFAGRQDRLRAGHALGTPEVLFAKIDDAVIAAQVQKLLDTKKANELAAAVAPAPKADVSFETFETMDLRVGTVLAAEKVPKTAKLLKLSVDLGQAEPRTIVSGIAEHYTDPAALVGQQVLVLANLAPRAIKGIQSQGMLLLAEDADGRLSLMHPEAPVRPGSKVA
jgi:methionyl-tRNA synthetase